MYHAVATNNNINQQKHIHTYSHAFNIHCIPLSTFQFCIVRKRERMVYVCVYVSFYWWLVVLIFYSIHLTFLIKIHSMIALVCCCADNWMRTWKLMYLNWHMRYALILFPFNSKVLWLECAYNNMPCTRKHPMWWVQRLLWMDILHQCRLSWWKNKLLSTQISFSNLFHIPSIGGGFPLSVVAMFAFHK